MRLICEAPKAGTELVREVTGNNPPSTVAITFEPLQQNTQLSGEPTNWCNDPSAGEPLIFSVPSPAPGEADTVGTLKVTKVGTSQTTNIPIRVKHKP